MKTIAQVKVNDGISVSIRDVLASNGVLSLTREPNGINYGIRHEKTGLLIYKVKLNVKQAQGIFRELCTLPFPWGNKDGSFLLDKVSGEIVKRYSPHLESLNEYRNIAHTIGAVFIKHGASF